MTRELKHNQSIPNCYPQGEGCCRCLPFPKRYLDEHAIGDCGANVPPSTFLKNLTSSLCRHICQHPESPFFRENLCNCKMPLSILTPSSNCCTGYAKKYVRSVSLDNMKNDFKVTYRRVNQAAKLIGYNKNPQSITRTDFVPKEIKYPKPLRGETPSSTIICNEIKRLGMKIPAGRKPFSPININPNMFIHRDCSNSSFKKIMQACDIGPTKFKPQSITKTDYLPKSLNGNIYSFEDPSKEYEPPSCHHKDMSSFINALENRDSKVGKKQKFEVDYNKDVNEEKCTFLRVMQAADYNNVTPNPVSMTTKEFRRKEYETPCGEPLLNNLKHIQVPLKNCVNMVRLYKNLEASKT